MATELEELGDNVRIERIDGLDGAIDVYSPEDGTEHVCVSMLVDGIYTTVHLSGIPGINDLLGALTRLKKQIEGK